MWRWLPNALCNKTLGCFSARRLFFLQLIGIVFAAHVVVFGMYGFIGWFQAGKDRYKISLSQSGATYVLMPLQKRVDQKKRGQSFDETRSLKKSNVLDLETYQRKKNNKTKTKMISAEKKASLKNKKVSKSTQRLQKQKTSVALKSEKKQSLQKSKLKKAITKIQEESLVEEVVKPNIEQPKELPIVEKQEVVAIAPIVATADVVETDDDFDENNVVFIGYEELDQSIVGSKIQHEIQQVWTPPVGMKSDIECEIRVKVDQNGQAIETKVIKSSGVFVYDATAKKTLQKIDYPKEVFNKSITIVLGAS